MNVAEFPIEKDMTFVSKLIVSKYSAKNVFLLQF